MRKVETVSYEKVVRTFAAVQDELIALGIWHTRSRLLRTDVVWCLAAPPWLWATTPKEPRWAVCAAIN